MSTDVRASAAEHRTAAAGHRHQAKRTQPRAEPANRCRNGRPDDRRRVPRCARRADRVLGRQRDRPIDGPGQLIIRSPDALRRIMWAPGELGFARAYIAGDLDVVGPIGEVLRAVAGVTAGRPEGHQDRAQERRLSPDAEGDRRGPRPRRARQAVAAAPGGDGPAGSRHSIRRDKQAVSHHYDVGNDFYEMVLGPSMTYSCARFVDATTTARGCAGGQARADLPQARPARASGDGRCRGCSTSDAVGGRWRSTPPPQHDARVVGVTISNEQAVVRPAAGRRGRARRSRRDPDPGLPRESPTVRSTRSRRSAWPSTSVERKMDDYFGTCTSLLRPGGRLLNHAISSVGGSRLRRAQFRVPLRLPRRRAARRRRSRRWRWSGPASRCATSRICASTTRRRCATGSPTSSATGTRRSSWSASAGRGCGCSTCRARSTASTTTASPVAPGARCRPRAERRQPHAPHPGHLGLDRVGACPSVDDIEREADGAVEGGSLDLVEPTDRVGVELRLRDRDDVVAVDHAPLGQTFVGADLHFRADPADRPSDRGTRDRGESLDHRIAVTARTPVVGRLADRDRPSRCRCALPRRRGSRRQTSSRSYERTVGRLPAIGGHEIAVRSRQFLGFDDRLSAATEQVRSTRAEFVGEPVELLDERVIELNEDLTPCHDHIVSHMVIDLAGGRSTLGSGGG